jgi:hypothetical protein
LSHYISRYIVPGAAGSAVASSPERPEMRRETRVHLGEPASIQEFDTTQAERISVVVVDISRSGLGLRAPRLLQSGQDIQIVLEHAFVLGEVRYCVPNGNGYHAGISVKNVLRLSR